MSSEDPTLTLTPTPEFLSEDFSVKVKGDAKKGIFGETFLVRFPQAKHENTSNNSGKIQGKIRGNIRDENSKTSGKFRSATILT